MESEVVVEGQQLLNDTDEREAKPLPQWKLAACTAILAGTQLCWGIQIGYSTKTFQEFGLPEQYVSAAWLAGPISGTIVQPIIGNWSDKCNSRFGRRRPFIVSGLLIVLTALFLFSNSDLIGTAAGENTATCSLHGCPVSLTVAIGSFWVLDFAINAVQGPARTLLTDVIPRSQQEDGNTWFAFMSSLGNGVGSFLGSANLIRVLAFFGTNLRALYTIAALLTTLTVLATVSVARERRLVPAAETSDGVAPSRPPLRKVIQLIPSPIKHAFTVQCFSWFAWFTTFIYATSWVGTQVYGGDPNQVEGSPARAVFDEGVRMGNLGLGFQALVAILYSCPSPWTPALLPWAIGRYGLKRMYVLSQVVQAVCLLSMVPISAIGAAHPQSVLAEVLAVAALGLLGITWASTMTIPWAITGICAEGNPNKGLVLALMNLSQATPEILSSLVGYLILSLPASVNPYGGAGVMFIGGVASILSVVTILYYRVGDGLELVRASPFKGH